MDAVFSINATYRSTTNVCHRYAAYARLVPLTPADALLPAEQQEPLDRFVQVARTQGDRLASDVLRNSGRTSTRSGIRKADAAVQYAEILVSHGLRTLADTTRAMADAEITAAVDTDLGRVKGHGLGARREYLWMLVGDDDRVKPDRMVLGWLSEVLGRKVVYEALELLTAAADALGCTVWELDHVVWQAQRGRRSP